MYCFVCTVSIVEHVYAQVISFAAFYAAHDNTYLEIISLILVI